MGSKTVDSQTGRLHAIEDYGTGRSRVSFESNHCWWNLAISFWSWEQTAKLCVEISITNSQKKQKWFLLQGKLWSSIFFYIDGMVYQHVVPAHTTVTGLYYRDILKVLQGHIRQKRPCLHATSWMLHHDNARPHVTNVVAEYLTQISVKSVLHLPYSPDLAQSDFLYSITWRNTFAEEFSIFRCSSEGCGGGSEWPVKNGFQHAFADWQKRWDKCIASNGDYFEKDHQYSEDE